MKDIAVGMDSNLDCYKTVSHHKGEKCQIDLGFSPEFPMGCMVISLYLSFLIFKMGMKKMVLHL